MNVLVFRLLWSPYVTSARNAHQGKKTACSYVIQLCISLSVVNSTRQYLSLYKGSLLVFSFVVDISHLISTYIFVVVACIYIYSPKYSNFQKLKLAYVMRKCLQKLFRNF